jgi:class 3 adenylate cyclase
MPGPPTPDEAGASLSVEQLAARAGTSPDRIAALTGRGVLTPLDDGRYRPGDIHRLRVLDAFAAAGVTVDALVEAARRGSVDFGYYEELHPPPGLPSERTYGDFRTSIGRLAPMLERLFQAFGLAEPDAHSVLSADDELFIADWLDALDRTGDPDLALRAVRSFGDATQRASEAALGVYADVVAKQDAELAGLPQRAHYERVFTPWARIAREAGTLAAWLTTQHMSRAIDAYSVEETERILAEGGLVPERSVLPAIAFLDLTGFTRLTTERGDEAAAAIALRLADVVGHVAARHGGRVVKLLGDGVLVRFPAATEAVDACLEALTALPAAGLPPGHIGLHAGPLISRDGDVFGATVNMAARVSDVTPSGELYVTDAVREAIAESGHRIEPVTPVTLAGIGEVRLFRVVPMPAGLTPGPTDRPTPSPGPRSRRPRSAGPTPR